MSKGAWRDAIARALGRSDVTESGVGRGGYSDNHGGHTYNDIGLTDRQTQIMDLYGEKRSLTEVAHELGISKSAVRNAIAAIHEKLNARSSHSDDVYDAWIDAGGAEYVADSGRSEQGQTNYDDPTVPGGDHPWLYDHEGNYIG